MTDSEEWHNPSEDYPPTRTDPLVFFSVAVVCAVGAVIMNWAVVSSFVHFSQIKTALGL